MYLCSACARESTHKYTEQEQTFAVVSLVRVQYMAWTLDSLYYYKMITRAHLGVFLPYARIGPATLFRVHHNLITVKTKYSCQQTQPAQKTWPSTSVLSVPTLRAPLSSTFLHMKDVVNQYLEFVQYPVPCCRTDYQTLASFQQYQLSSPWYYASLN